MRRPLASLAGELRYTGVEVCMEKERQEKNWRSPSKGVSELLIPCISDGGKAGLTRCNPVGDTFPYHDDRCMGTT